MVRVVRGQPYPPDRFSKSARSDFQNTAQVWVPWPWVSGRQGIRTNLPPLMRLTSVWARPSSGGLMKSSQEFTQVSGALIFSRSGEGAADFLQHAVRAIPSCPPAIQTDNGSEFALHFAAAVATMGRLRFHTHPYSPKENAHIERFNRSLNEEFLVYHRALLRVDVGAFNVQLMEWLLWYNAERPHHALGLQSPFRAMMMTLSASECQKWWTDTNN